MIWDDVMDYGRYCGLIGYQKVLPVYLCSIGAHIGNYHNKGVFAKPPFYTTRGQVPDIRIHVFSVGPPGYGKSLYSRFFLDDRVGLISEAIPSHRQGQLTGKGLTGGYEKEERIVGEAEIYSTGFIGIEEFDHVIQAGRQEHSADIGNALLDLLDSGYFRYRKGNKDPVEYQSYFTLFAGTQPERFEVGTGLARRVAFLDQIPDDSVRKALFDSHYTAVGIEPNMSTIREVRSKIKHLWESFAATQVELTPEYMQMAMKLASNHLELAYLDKFAIGYRIIRYYRGGKKLLIEPDAEMYELLKMVKAMRTGCMFGANELAVLKLLETPKEMTELKLIATRELHMDYKSVSKSLKDLIFEGAVQIVKVNRPNCKKPVNVLRRAFLIQ